MSRWAISSRSVIGGGSGRSRLTSCTLKLVVPFFRLHSSSWPSQDQQGVMVPSTRHRHTWPLTISIASLASGTNSSNTHFTTGISFVTIRDTVGCEMPRRSPRNSSGLFCRGQVDRPRAYPRPAIKQVNPGRMAAAMSRAMTPYGGERTSAASAGRTRSPAKATGRRPAQPPPQEQARFIGHTAQILGHEHHGDAATSATSVPTRASSLSGRENHPQVQTVM
jgi:hypothetical protein